MTVGLSSGLEFGSCRGAEDAEALHEGRAERLHIDELKRPRRHLASRPILPFSASPREQILLLARVLCASARNKRLVGKRRRRKFGSRGDAEARRGAIGGSFRSDAVGMGLGSRRGAENAEVWRVERAKRFHTHRINDCVAFQRAVTLLLLRASASPREQNHLLCVLRASARTDYRYSAATDSSEG